MSGPEEHGAAPLLVDVHGLPGRLPLEGARAQVRIGRRYMAFGVAYLALQLVLDGASSVFLLIGAAWFFLGLSMAVVAPRAHLRLEPHGVRRVGVVGAGRLTPWSDVAAVRPPDAWHGVPHLRGHGRYAETTDLGGLTAEQAAELQRRLVEARRDAAPGAESDEAQV